MKIVVALALLFTGTSAIKAPRQPQQHGRIIYEEFDLELEWNEFKNIFGKSYSPSEEVERKKIFEVSLARAQERNQANINAGGKHIFGVTKFSDITQEEFNFQFKGRKGQGYLPENHKEKVKLPTITKAEGISQVDWTADGFTTPVKNQGQCGSCWAHSAVEQIESQWMWEGGAPWELSVQQVTSCTAGTFGCGGGDTTGAYEQLMKNATKEGEYTPGVGSAVYLPYRQSMYEQCLGPLCTIDCTDSDLGNLTVMTSEQSLTGPFVSVNDYSFATPACDDACDDQNLEVLNLNVAENGPASICVNAGAWNDYVGGVMTTAACGGYAYDDLDHCVQLTGFDMTVREPFYRVRNSWAINWGIDGYIYLSAEGNTCGLADEATFVDVNKP